VTALYLASTSPERKKILSDIGLKATVVAPDVDEDKAVEAMTIERTASNVALHLAKLKAESVVKPSRKGLIIGGDSVFEFGGELLGKPHKASVAKDRWKAMRGRTGTLYSGLWVVDNSDGSHHGGLGRVSHATVHFAENITDAEIDAYVKTGEPLNVAGAFTLDARGAALISHLEGDPWAVVGMSASALRVLIRGLGHDYHSLWSS
jgi:septum formation protein